MGHHFFEIKGAPQQHHPNPGTGMRVDAKRHGTQAGGFGLETVEGRRASSQTLPLAAFFASRAFLASSRANLLATRSALRFFLASKAAFSSNSFFLFSAASASSAALGHTKQECSHHPVLGVANAYCNQ